MTATISIYDTLEEVRMLIWTHSPSEKLASKHWTPRTSIILVTSHPSRFRHVMLRLAARILGFEAR